MKKILILSLLVITIISADDLLYAQNDHGFRFIRIQYDSYGGGGSIYGRGRRQAPWAHDYPTAEDNLYEAISKTTKIDLAGQYMVLSLRDERIFEYPFLYMCEPGFWYANEEEIKNLREYLNRGGFIMFDDFRTRTGEWNNLKFIMKMVFPDKEPVQLPPDHEIWSIYYDIDPIEAPSWVSGGYGKYDDEYWAYFDDKGRMMALACVNQDIGDGWEWPQRRLDRADTLPFQMGINIIIYVLTH
ncbi:DUF4159 domain-containing protein [candidate division KSB1 bacterium]|nr:DUF4159 domain-containing protein [candidate division KSB1 bacterium]